MDGHRVDRSRPGLLTLRLTTLTGVLALVTGGVAHAGDDPDIDVGGCQVVEFCVGVGVGDETGGSGGQAGGSQGGGSDLACGYTKVEPKPPAEYPAWQGKDPNTYDLYFRSCSDGGQDNPDGFVAVPVGQPPVPQVDPQELAQRAVDSMTLLGPDIAISPRPGGQGLVGMPVWMAVGRSQTTWGPNTASASAGGVTVTATAEVAKVVWVMGDGASVTCLSPGTVYRKSYGLRRSPDCGHVYTRPSASLPGATYRVTATSTWVIDWQGGGAAGQVTEVRDSSVAVAVVESQAVNS